MSVQDYYFKNGKIYKIIDNTSDMIYVGSTCYSLEDRLKGHEKTFKTYQKGKKARCLTSYKILINGNYKIELIEKFPCENSKQLFEREGFYIRKFKNEGLNIVNKTTLGLTWEQQLKKRKEKYICECGGKYTGETKSQHQYTQKHKKFILNPKIIIPGNNNNITINIYCQSKEDIDLFELEKDFLNAIK
jgi:hypothetical protein